MVKPSDAGEGDGGEREEEGHEGETAATAVGNDESAGSSSVVVAAAVVERVPRLAVAEESLSSSAASSLSLEHERDTSATDRSPSTPSAAAAPGMTATLLQGTSSTPRPLTFSSPHCDDVIQTLAEEFEVEETKL